MEKIPVELLDFDLWKSGILLVVLKIPEPEKKLIQEVQNNL